MNNRRPNHSPDSRSKPTSRPGPRAPSERSDDAHAFIPDPSEGPSFVREDLSEMLGEEFVSAATSGEQTTEDTLNEVVPEEVGGPFVSSSAAEELASGTDAANPRDATREPLPRANAGRGEGDDDLEADEERG